MQVVQQQQIIYSPVEDEEIEHQHQKWCLFFFLQKNKHTNANIDWSINHLFEALL